MDFNYVDIKTKGFEGCLNLFFGEYIIAMVNNIWLANKIREKIDGATEQPVIYQEKICGMGKQTI